MIITICGKNGSGKSTIADILAEKLNLKRYSVGNFRRERAKKLGMTLEEYNRFGEKEQFTDKEADNWQKKIGEKEDNFVIDGRLSYHFIPDSIKIFLSVSPEEGAKRIMLQKRDEERAHSLEEAVEIWHARIQSDIKRYEKYYGLNPYNEGHYDFVLDTSNLNIEEVYRKVMEFIENGS